MTYELVFRIYRGCTLHTFALRFVPVREQEEAALYAIDRWCTQFNLSHDVFRVMAGELADVIYESELEQHVRERLA